MGINIFRNNKLLHHLKNNDFLECDRILTSHLDSPGPALHYACEHGNIAMVQLILNHTSDLNTFNDEAMNR